MASKKNKTDKGLFRGLLLIYLMALLSLFEDYMDATQVREFAVCSLLGGLLEVPYWLQGTVQQSMALCIPIETHG